MKSLLPRAAPALLATVLLAATAEVAAAGPPAICHPFQVKGDLTIPASKDDWSEVAVGLTTEKVVELALAGVAASDDTLVHMETLRRAVVALRGVDPRSAATLAERQRIAATLLTQLEERVASLRRLAETDPRGVARKLALATFDLGFAAAAFTQAGTENKVDYAHHLDGAIAQSEETDGAMHFGAALAFFGERKGERRALEHFSAALGLVGTDEYLSKNLLETGRRFFETHTLAELRAKIRQELEST